MLLVSFKCLPPPQLLQHAYLTTCNLLVQSTTKFFDLSIYLFVYTLLFLMPKRKLPKGFFKQAYNKGFKCNKYIVNGEEIRKKLQPKTEKNYTCVRQKSRASYG
jgi:hypothetical protein